MRAFDRDLIRGGHYGQRSCEPHTGRTHGCTDPSLRREESPCQPGAVHTWHKADMPVASLDVRFRGKSGQHVVVLSFSAPTENGFMAPLTSFAAGHDADDRKPHLQ